MRRLSTALALMLACGTTHAFADCKSEVEAALKKQRESGAFRMEVDMISQDGPMKMTVEYKLPDRMRQVVRLAIDPKPVETVLVGQKAWSNHGEGWTPLAPDLTSGLIQQFRETVGGEMAGVGTFDCMGSVVVDGQEVMSYRGYDEQPGSERIVGKAAEEAKSKPKEPDTPVRMFYTDPKTGLPVRSVFGRASRLDRPVFKAVYTYPSDITIEEPKDVKAP